MIRSLEAITPAIWGYATGWVLRAQVSWPRSCHLRLARGCGERLLGRRERGGLAGAREHQLLPGWLWGQESAAAGDRSREDSEMEYLFLVDSLTACCRGFQARLAPLTSGPAWERVVQGGLGVHDMNAMHVHNDENVKLQKYVKHFMIFMPNASCSGEVRDYLLQSETGVMNVRYGYVGATCHSDKNDMRW